MEKLVGAPGGALGPVKQNLSGPSGGFVGMAGGAGIGDFIFVGHGGSDEGKSVSANRDVGEGGFDFGHVAGNATAAGRTFFVMGMLFDGGGARTIQGKRAVAIEAAWG